MLIFAVLSISLVTNCLRLFLCHYCLL